MPAQRFALLSAHDVKSLLEQTPAPHVINVCTDAGRRCNLPGAVYLDYKQLVRPAPPVLGFLPDSATLSRVLSAIGLTPDAHVIAYDDEGGARACRLLWTLDTCGHRGRLMLLDGGTQAWQQAGLGYEPSPATPAPAVYPIETTATAHADKAYILAHLADGAIQVLDTRSQSEYDGSLPRANRNGHIPGAINVEWTKAMQAAPGKPLKPLAEIEQLYADAGVDRDKEVIVHCHSHHRSAHSYFVLKLLGYPKVRAYSGSWSEWGNAPDTPVEQ